MTRSRIARWKDLRRWLPGHEGLPDALHDLVPLADVLDRRDDRVAPEDFERHQPITIRFGGDIEPRDRQRPFAGSMFAVHAGDLVFSKIDVRNGAIGLMPGPLAPGVVTAEYPVYVPDPEQVDAAFLAVLLRTEAFRGLLHSAASGTSGRKRVHPDQFEALEVPLPDLPEQRRLAAAHAKARAEADRLDADARRAEAEAVAAFEAALGLAPPPDLPRQRSRIARFAEMDRWSHEGAIFWNRSQAVADSSVASFEPLGDYVEVLHGCSASPSAKETGHWVLKISAATKGHLRAHERKPMLYAEDRFEKYALSGGDLLLCRTNGTLAYVGMSALVPDDLTDTIFPDKLIRVRVVEDGLLPEYLWRVLQLPSIRLQIEGAARTAVGNYAIGSSDVAEFEIPVPSPSEQRELTGALMDDLEHARSLRRSAAAAREAAGAAFAEALFG